MRQRVVAKVGDNSSLRDVASRAGISHHVLHKLIHGKTVAPASLAKIQAWLDQPEEDQVVLRFRQDLRRLLGPLSARAFRAAQLEVGRVLAHAFVQAGLEAPTWVGSFGNGQPVASGSDQPRPGAKVRSIRRR